MLSSHRRAPRQVRPRLAGRWKRDRKLWSALAAVLVAAGIAASLVVAREQAASNSSSASLAFRSSAADVASTLELAIQHEQDLVVSGAAFMAANPHATQARFLAWSRSVRALKRYPELQGLGFVVVVPAAGVAAFASRPGAKKETSFTIVPPGKRPFYCLGLVGFQRLALSVPSGLDYCVTKSTTFASRDTGRGSYSPVDVIVSTWLSIQTPVYRGGGVPTTVQARRQAFLGWLGEALDPGVVLRRALQGHTDEGVSLVFGIGKSSVTFTSG